MKIPVILSAVLFLLIVAFLFFLKLNESSNILNLLLTISTFLLGIFLAFAVSERQNRIERIRENDSKERGMLESLYYLSAIFGQKTQKRIADIIDDYLTSTLDYYIWDYYKTEKDFSEIMKTIESLNPKTRKQEEVFGSMLTLLTDIEQTRNQSIAIIDDKLATFEWVILLLLSGTIIASTFLIPEKSILSTIIFGVIDFAILLLLLFLNNLDNLSWKEEERIFEPYQRTFETIGKLRYYPDGVIERGRVKLHKGKTYRIASYPKPYPDMRGKKVKIIKDKTPI